MLLKKDINLNFARLLQASRGEYNIVFGRMCKCECNLFTQVTRTSSKPAELVIKCTGIKAELEIRKTGCRRAMTKTSNKRNSLIDLMLYLAESQE